jgi:TRAP-type uncharacterized transport system substrate-binding protein
LAIVLLVAVSSAMVYAGCTPGTDQSEEAGQDWQWPDNVHIAAPGQSGLAKYVSWASIMEADTGTAIRVVSEADPGKCMRYLMDGEMFLSSASKNELRNVIEAIEDHATENGGPFQARIVWVHDLANSGFFVRGDSDINTIYDIGPGTRFSVWNMRDSTLNPSRCLLAWIQLDEEEIDWVDAGSFEGAMRAVAEGRADIAFGFPTSPTLYEVAAAPHGIRFLDLNGEADPEGARRWQARDPMYSFGPIATGVPEAIDHWGTVGYIFDITDESSDPELVYHFAKWLDENYEQYKDTYDSNKYMSIDNLMEALKTTYIPVHEGLIEYLKEKDLWTDAHDRRQEENIEIFTTYVNAYNEAKNMAESEGIEISPANPDWIALWETYKVEHEIPMIGLHVSLTESGETVIPTDVSEPESQQETETNGETTSKVTSDSGLSFEFTSVTDPATINETITVEGKATPGAECTLVMTLSEGTVSSFPKDPVKIADEDGNVEWEWVLFSHTPSGETKLEVNVTLEGDSVTATYYFTVSE